MAESAVLVQSDGPANILRQAGMLIGIAASVALGVYVVMWSRTPNYSLLYADLADRDVTQIADALKASDIPHRIDPSSGGILVAAARVHDARLKLAAAGLPKSASMGFELMQEEQGFGTSQFLERARYQRAIEGELSRSIARINNVRNARVHLGLPPQTVFSRTRREPSASVILDLYSGRNLSASQVNAITHLVSASVPNLPIEKVTVVDQQGNLLTNAGGDDAVVLTGKRFEYQQLVERNLMESIEAILMPFVGADGVRAQVTADLDFTATEQTRESFNPDLPVVRSERLLEEERIGGNAGGVPGALSNQPPPEASAPEEFASEDADAFSATEGQESTPSKPESKRTQSTRNYEIDRTISHTKPSIGTIRRLSVAVVLRALPQATPSADAAEAPEETAAPPNGPDEEAAPVEVVAEQAPVLEGGFTPEQIAKMTELVKKAVGFDLARGDSVSLSAAEFITPASPEALPEVPLWEQPWVWDVGKQVLGALFVLFLVFGVLRPAMKSLVKTPATLDGNFSIGADGSLVALPGGDGSGATEGAQAALPSGAEDEASGPAHAMIKGPELPRDVEGVRDYVNKEPKIAAQVVRGWIGDES